MTCLATVSALLDIRKIFYEAYNDGLPELLSDIVFTKIRNGYWLQGKDCLLVHSYHGYCYVRAVFK